MPWLGARAGILQRGLPEAPQETAAPECQLWLQETGVEGGEGQGYREEKQEGEVTEV